MEGQEDLIRALALLPSDARRRAASAGRSIAEIAWRHRNADFRFWSVAELDDRVNSILRDLSDGLMKDAEDRARLLLLEMELDEYYDDAIANAKEERKGHAPLWRLDMEASHLKLELEAWIRAAFVTGATLQSLKASIENNIERPWESAEWVEAGFSKPSFGKGYQSNTVLGSALIMQDILTRTTRLSQIRDFRAKGAVGYRTVRASSFHCPFCDEMAERIWPLSEDVLPYHPRCVCIAVPVYADEL